MQRPLTRDSSPRPWRHLLALGALLAGGCAGGMGGGVEFQTGHHALRTPHGLYLLEDPVGVGGEVFAKPGVDFASYHKVMLDPVVIRYKQGSPLPSPAEQEALRRAFEKEFEQELRQSSVYAYVTAPGPDVLRVTAHAIDVELAQDPEPGGGPEASLAGSESFSADQGWMTLMLDLSDSESHQPLVLATERREIGAPGGGGNMVSETATVSDSRFLFHHWALLLKGWLDRVKDIPPLPASLEQPAAH